MKVFAVVEDCYIIDEREVSDYIHGIFLTEDGAKEYISNSKYPNDLYFVEYEVIE